MEQKELDLLDEGKMLPLMESFYSIQGEGYNTGRAAYFFRVGGCDVGCYWCDVKESWNPNMHPLVSVDKMVEDAANCPAKAVVITGGEPLTYNLVYLTSQLSKNNIEIFVETSGSQKLSGNFDWICLSPKKKFPPLDEYYKNANELKIIIHDDSDFEWAESNAKKVNANCKLYLQPEWSKVDVMMQKINDYILKYPKWMISLQSHKYMNIP